MQWLLGLKKALLTTIFMRSCERMWQNVPPWQKLVLNSDAAYAKKIGPRLLLAAAGQANVPMIDMLLAAGIKPVENAIGFWQLMSRAAQKDQYRTALASAVQLCGTLSVAARREG